MRALLLLLALAGCATLTPATPDHDAVTARAVAVLSRTYQANGMPAPPVASVRWELGYHVAGSTRGGVTIWDGHGCDIRVATHPAPPESISESIRSEREGGIVSGTDLAHEIWHCCWFAAGVANGDREHQRSGWCEQPRWANQMLALEGL